MPGNRNVKLRVKTGIFKGCEGYIVRIDRDRQLVFDSGGYAVASIRVMLISMILSHRKRVIKSD